MLTFVKTCMHWRISSKSITLNNVNPCSRVSWDPLISPQELYSRSALWQLRRRDTSKDVSTGIRWLSIWSLDSRYKACYFHQYYTKCTTGPTNPFHGAISFDNIGLAWVAIFLVISLEGWTDVMYFVQDAHSFWNWIYFVCLIVVSPHFCCPLFHNLIETFPLGWVLLHDQPLPGRHRHPVLGDKEARDGQDEGGESQVHLVLHPVLLHQQVGPQSWNYSWSDCWDLRGMFDVKYLFKPFFYSEENLMFE